MLAQRMEDNECNTDSDKYSIDNPIVMPQLNTLNNVMKIASGMEERNANTTCSQQQVKEFTYNLATELKNKMLPMSLISNITGRCKMLEETECVSFKKAKVETFRKK
jgi:hypothetical protein